MPCWLFPLPGDQFFDYGAFILLLMQTIFSRPNTLEDFIQLWA
jgi:hypothetical protein